jgi:hypothetical protein
MVEEIRNVEWLVVQDSETDTEILQKTSKHLTCQKLLAVIAIGYGVERRKNEK